MKKILLVLLIVGFGAMVNAQKKPYNNLIITEARISVPNYNYVELTNMGTETIDLSEFEIASVGPWSYPWGWYVEDTFRFPQKMLAPGKSYVISGAYKAEPQRWLTDPLHNRERVTPLEMYNLADTMITMDAAESSGIPGWKVINVGWGYSVYLKHIYTIGEVQDSMIIDQVGGIFDEEDGTSGSHPYDVAGVKDATWNSILMRKASVTTGITEFSSHEANDEAARMQFANNRGLDLADSEWIPVHVQGDIYDADWRAVYWTVGNQADYKLDANTLVSKIPGKFKVDLDKATITVPWGVRYNDSIMAQMVKKPGIAWQYGFAPTSEDSTYTSARTGDKLTIYVIGNEATIKTFSIIVADPTPSDNIVMSKTVKQDLYKEDNRKYAYFKVSDGISGMDTISNINYALRVDTLYKYLEKTPKATWKIIPKNGIIKPDLIYGDKLQVTSENGTVKEYFLKLNKILQSEDAKLASITWPDIPSYFKGDVAGLYGWKGDTIPGFSPGNQNYVITIPLEYEGIPALMFTKENLNSKVVVDRAKTLEGTLEDATVTFTVTAEDDTTKYVYTVRFNKEKDPKNVQKWIAEPYISQLAIYYGWSYALIEIANPGTEPIDLSHYMITKGVANVADIFKAWNGIADWKDRLYEKYVPGKKWQDEANWQVQPRILETDLATNAIVAPGDVFVAAAMPVDPYPFEVPVLENDIDFNFMATPWGANYGANNTGIGLAYNRTICLFKILNDSVVRGLKPATDINDFELIDVFGDGTSARYLVGGFTIRTTTGLTRKPNIYKGNTTLKGSWGTNQDDTEWIRFDPAINQARGYTEWPFHLVHNIDGMGSQVIDPVTMYRSTVTSLFYKVSPGFSQTEKIRGLTTGTTVTDFYNKIIKANALQALKVKSAVTGNELAEAAAISNGDMLIVLSADSTNTTTYILDVTATGLSSNAVLTSTNYTIDVTGTTGTIAGFPQRTLLKTVFAGVIVPPGATINIIDENDAYMSLTKLNYDTAYVNVIATDHIYFEVVAENGTTMILYQLKPTTNSSDAYVTSDIYSVDQFASLIQFVPGGTTATSLLSNVTPAPGATIAVYDKVGFVRENGDIYQDDKLVVISADGNTIKTYYLSVLNNVVNTYLAYVISDDYAVDQIKYTIVGPSTKTTLGEFYAKLYPSFGAKLSVLDKDGNVSALADLSLGDKLLVTAADGKTKVVYDITVDITGFETIAETIKMYPNPTSDGRVIVQGLAKGNRVQVFNVSGITLRDVIVDNSTEYVSLSAQPAGIYMFVISSGDKHISIQKIIKK